MMPIPIIRTSERRTFKRCQAQWWWSWREGLQPRGSESTPLWFGTGVHLAFAQWYLPGVKRGVHPAETFRTYAEGTLHAIKTKDATEERVAEYEDGLALGLVLMDEYVKKYGTDPHMDFIQAEHPFRLDIPWPDATRQTAYEVETGALIAMYMGTYDGVYRDLTDGKLKLLETKTAKAVSTKHLGLDDQAGSYWATASIILRKLGLLGPKERIHGIEYNFVRKAMPDDRPTDAEGYACNKPVKADYAAALGIPDHELRKMKIDYLENMAQSNKVVVLGERSKIQPPPLFERHLIIRTSREQTTQLRRIQDEAVQMQLVRDQVVTPTKNPTRDCSWDCSFFNMCELQERGGDWKDFKKIAYRVEDPYADHRKSAED
jgi:hypothetical protein